MVGLICKCPKRNFNDIYFTDGHAVGNHSFKDLIDLGTFSLVRLLRNMTPPSGGGGLTVH